MMGLHAPPNPATPTVFSDMEGTLSSGVTWQGMRNYLIQHGRQQEVRRFLTRNMLKVILFRLGLIRNKQKFQREWLLGILVMFGGLSRVEFSEACAWVVENELWPNRRKDVLAELEAHAAAGRRVILVSGMFAPMLAIFAEKVGFEALGTAVAFDDNDIFTGQLVDDFNTGERKAELAQPFLDPDTPDSNSQLYAAYGDTAADIPMLHLAVHPIAVYPDAGLRQAAQARGWRIIES